MALMRYVVNRDHGFRSDSGRQDVLTVNYVGPERFEQGRNGHADAAQGVLWNLDPAKTIVQPSRRKRLRVSIEKRVLIWARVLCQPFEKLTIKGLISAGLRAYAVTSMAIFIMGTNSQADRDNSPFLRSCRTW